MPQDLESVVIVGRDCHEKSFVTQAAMRAQLPSTLKIEPDKLARILKKPNRDAVFFIHLDARSAQPNSDAKPTGIMQAEKVRAAVPNAPIVLFSNSPLVTDHAKKHEGKKYHFWALPVLIEPEHIRQEAQAAKDLAATIDISKSGGKGPG